MFFAEDYLILFKTAIGVCSLMENHFLSHRFDESVFHLRYCTNNLTEDELLKKITMSKISREKFESKLKKELSLNKNISK